MHSAREYNGLSSHQLEVLKVALLRQILISLDPMANISASAIMANADEFNALPTHVLQVLQTQLLCEISSTGVGGSSPQVLNGSGPPVAPPTVSPAIYFDNAPAALTTLYWWPTAGAAWIPFG